MRKSRGPTQQVLAASLLAPQRGLTAANKRPLTRPDGSGRPLPWERLLVLLRRERAPNSLNNLSQGEVDRLLTGR